jgi:hypothetical protein
MPTSHKGHERIAKLEQHKEDTDKQIERVLSTLKHIDSKMGVIEGSVGKIQVKVEKGVSFLGGVAFAFSALGALFVMGAQVVAKKLGII